MGAQELPDDFGDRLRAARAYLDLSRDQFADELATPGLSSSTIKGYEGGTRPEPLKAAAIIARLVEVTGLPASFFWGAPAESELIKRVDRIEKVVEDIHKMNLAGFSAIRSLLEGPPTDEEQRRRQAN